MSILTLFILNFFSFVNLDGGDCSSHPTLCISKCLNSIQIQNFFFYHMSIMTFGNALMMSSFKMFVIFKNIKKMSELL